MIGTRLGPYAITAKLGAGGMGEVYRATDTRLGREVALKLLPEAFVADPDPAHALRARGPAARLAQPSKTGPRISPSDPLCATNCRSTLTKLAPEPRIAAMTDDVSRLLVRELSAFAREVELFPDDESLFRTLPGVTNSAGNLALHVSGNLKHFVGAVLGGTGYVRDRDAEFGARSGRREDVVRELRETATVVADTLGRLPLEALEKPYPQPVANLELPCRLFLMHLAVHLSFHLGQAGYLRRIVTADNHTSGTVAIAELASPRG